MPMLSWDGGGVNGWSINPSPFFSTNYQPLTTNQRSPADAVQRPKSLNALCLEEIGGGVLLGPAQNPVRLCD